MNARLPDIRQSAFGQVRRGGFCGGSTKFDRGCFEYLDLIKKVGVPNLV